VRKSINASAPALFGVPFIECRGGEHAHVIAPLETGGRGRGEKVVGFVLERVHDTRGVVNRNPDFSDRSGSACCCTSWTGIGVFPDGFEIRPRLDCVVTAIRGDEPPV